MLSLSKVIKAFSYQWVSALICFSLPLMMIVVGYMVAPVLFAELGQKQAGEIAARLFSYTSLIVLSGLLLIISLYLLFEKQVKSIKSLLVSVVLIAGLKFWISPWMAEIKARYPAGLDYASADWRVFAGLHGVYQLFYLLLVILMLYWSFRVFAIIRDMRNN